MPIQRAAEDVVDRRALVEMLPDVVFVVDAEVKLSYVNDAVTDVLGWPPEDWLGRSVLDLVHPDDLAIVLSSAMALRGKRAGTPIEVCVRAAGGGWKWLAVIGADGVERDGLERCRPHNASVRRRSVRRRLN